MNKSDLMEMALEKLVGDMDDLEGAAAMAHDVEECPDPLSCTMHESESGEALSSDAKPGDKPGLPSMKGTPSKGDGDGAESPAEDGLSDEEKEALRNLLK